MNKNNPDTNILQIRDDRKRLKSKGIKSPALKDLPYYIYDKRQRAKFFFATKKKYRETYERLTKQSGKEFLKVSHPKLISQTDELR